MSDINLGLGPKLIITTLISSSLILSGCGGSSSTDTAASTSTVNKGVITGFGSIYVNGIKFETVNSEFLIDDEIENDQDNLRIGMVVKINGSVNADGKTGTASFIQYDNELKGPVTSVTDIDATTKEIEILGRTVTVTTDTVFDDDGGLTFDSLTTSTIGTILEVSGLETTSGLTATHIEQQESSSEIELLGAISNISGSSLNDFSFQVHGFDVQTSATTELDDISQEDLANGLFVEVEGALNSGGTALEASKIELKEEGLGDDDADEAEIEGLISNYVDADSTFTIQGQTIDASSAELYPTTLTLADGLTVEAEGEIVNGVLIAEKVKQKGNKIEISSSLSAIDTVNGTVTFTFNSTDIVVRVNNQTEIEDLSENEITISDLSINDFVEMKAFYDGTTTINAIELEIDNDNEVEIEGPVDAFNESANTVTVLGVEFDLSSATFESTTVSSSFYNQLSVGTFIGIEDENNDGVIDEVEIEDND